jgi:hypothetical protein
VSKKLKLTNHMRPTAGGAFILPSTDWVAWDTRGQNGDHRKRRVAVGTMVPKLGADAFGDRSSAQVAPSLEEPHLVEVIHGSKPLRCLVRKGRLQRREIPVVEPRLTGRVVGVGVFTRL